MTQPTPPPEDQQPTPQQGHPVLDAVALAAIAKGLPDPWLPLRWRHLARMVRAERSVHAAFAKALGGWLVKARRETVHGKTVDPFGVKFASQAFAAAADDVVDIQVREVFEEAFEAAAGWEPDPNVHTERYLADVRNRMRNTPDSVFNLVREEVTKATREGTPVEELAAQIDQLLSANEVPTWKNRGLVVARTETISAYNAGTFAGMQSYAAQLGGDWEKAWLATDDARTRPTHVAADGQRVPLAAPFAVGGAFGMFPGAPELPPEERIQCRCTLLLARPGEPIDLSNRQFREPK